MLITLPCWDIPDMLAHEFHFIAPWKLCRLRLDVCWLRLAEEQNRKASHYLRKALVFPLVVVAGCLNDSDFSLWTTEACFSGGVFQTGGVGLDVTSWIIYVFCNSGPKGSQ